MSSELMSSFIAAFLFWRARRQTNFWSRQYNAFERTHFIYGTSVSTHYLAMASSLHLTAEYLC